MGKLSHQGHKYILFYYDSLMTKKIIGQTQSITVVMAVY